MILANKISNTSPANKLSMNYAIEALENKERVNVYVYKMDSTFSNLEGNALTIDKWAVSSLGYDSQTIQVLLSSGIDAVGEIIATATSQGAKAGESRTLRTLQNSRSSRTRIGL